MSEHEQPNKQELAALELLHQLINMSPDDGDRALMVTLRLPNGRYVGDVWLSTGDVERLTGGAMVIAHVEPATAPLPIDEREIKGLADEVEAFLQDGGEL